ncbi:MAG TPA: metallophosphoesterase family protein, partial [Burkholderiaceae bacterium]|nr:metallophosphoesterase family protein [Burkholderiaceae bacterium]
MDTSQRPLRFAAVGDIHCTKESAGTLRGFFAQACEGADALLLSGDLTDYGLAEEAKVLADELSVVSVPVVAVLGNHDFESGIHCIARGAVMEGRQDDELPDLL